MTDRGALLRRALCSSRLERLQAVLHHDPECVHEMMAGHQDPTPLFYLPDDEQRATHITRLLLSYRADVTMRNDSGQTAADAVLARSLDAAAMLMDPSIGADA
ncbi:hypothetical protein [Gemmatimonas sp.]|uniref:hypothetical protein n=1 Tax=Gemmatimonas sp. TaxID=1962908 RepID=UPI0037BE838A